LPIKKVKGVSSMGRSSGMTNKLALALKQLEQDNQRDAADGKNGQDQKASEEQFDG
jgi:hypothetical protein